MFICYFVWVENCDQDLFLIKENIIKETFPELNECINKVWYTLKDNVGWKKQPLVKCFLYASWYLACLKNETVPKIYHHFLHGS